MDWQQTLTELLDKLVGWIEAAVLQLPNLALAVLIVVAFWLGAKVVRKVLRRGLESTPAPRQIRNLVVNVAGVAMLALGAFVALGVLELDKTVTSLLAGAGIIGLALGFAFQDMASNFMAGVYLAVARPVKVGDIVETNDYMGVVERVDLRTTTLRLPQGPRVMIPNKEVFENPLVNYNATGHRRVDLACGVAYGDDLERAREVAVGALEGVSDRDGERPVELYYEEFGGSSVNFVVRLWIPYEKQSDYLAARSEAIVRLKKAFDEAGITIPFPIRTLDFGVVGGEKLSEALPAGLLGDGGGAGNAPAR